jgi:PKD repeat protein
MKRSLLLVLAFSFVTGVVFGQYKRCATTEYNEMLMKQDPAFRVNQDNLEQIIQNRMIADKTWKKTGTITIPVVFHVLYSNAAQNISNARIQAQLDVLNADFSATNSDIVNVPAGFQPDIANTDIQFCLAVRDPQGNTTDGIIRKQTSTPSFSTNNAIKFDAQGGDNAWPANSYLNIWVGNLSGGLLGYAQFPGGSAATDGVVLLYSAVGGPNSPGTAVPYHLGRSGTHEIGHWLNLRHIWGDSTCGNDFCADTPTQSGPNFGCPNYPSPTGCSGTAPNGEMFMNYMDYVDDDCMIMFTNDQSTRINTSVTTTRAAILNSMGCVPVTGGAPTADFSASLTSFPVGTSINFTDMSSGNPTSWSWTFAGGTPGTSVDQNPMNITYNTPGTYDVTLTVTNANGSDTETKNGYITVLQGGSGTCDTLTNFPANGTPTIFQSSGWGYVAGHNDYEDAGKADKYSTFFPTYTINGALIQFAVATASNSTNTFDVKVWDSNGAAGAPNTVLGSESKTFQDAELDVIAQSLTYVQFMNPISVSQPFYLGVEWPLPYTPGDTLAIVTCDDGEVGPDFAWELWNDGTWHSYSETPASWGLDMAHSIWPIMCDPLGINDPVQDGIVIYPNPTSGQLIIHNTLNQGNQAVVRVVNMNGQVSLNRSIQRFDGTHYIDMSELADGLYFIEVISGEQRLSYKVLLAK